MTAPFSRLDAVIDQVIGEERIVGTVVLVAEDGRIAYRCAAGSGQSGEARIFLIQDDNLTAEVPLRRSILQSTLRQKYRSTGRHNPQRDGGPEKGLYRLHP